MSNPPSPRANAFTLPPCGPGLVIRHEDVLPGILRFPFCSGVKGNEDGHEEKQAKKKGLSFGHFSDPGTGVGYSFIFHHLGVAQWEYSLVKMSSSQEVGKGTCKSLRMGLSAMNEILSKLEYHETTAGLASASTSPQNPALAADRGHDQEGVP